MMSADFTYEAPESLGEAVRLVQERENVIPLAGGTDLVPLMKYGVKKPACLVDLKKIYSLKVDHPQGRRPL